MASTRNAAIAAVSLVIAACAAGPARRPIGPAASGAVAPALPTPPQSAARVRESFVERAKTMLDEPYRYGGSAPGGFDCSGLVTYAAQGVGLKVPRTAAEQLRAGMPIARASVRAGDLVFMHLRGKELHVGIAIDEARFIHAPATGRRVRIDYLAAAPYSRAFIAARRIIDDEPALGAAHDSGALQSSAALLPVH